MIVEDSFASSGLPRSREIEPINDASSLKIAISANFPVLEVVEMLDYWLLQLRLSASLILGSGESLVQQLLDEQSPIHSADFAVVLIQLEKCTPTQGLVGHSESSDNVEFLARTIELGSKARSLPLLVLSCAQYQPQEQKCPVSEMEQELFERLRSVSNLEFLRAKDITALYPVRNSFEQFGNAPPEILDLLYTREYLASLATVIARRLYARFCRPRKVIVVDCDDTLWTGNCGEQGPLGVSILDGNRALQESLVRQFDSGKLICICSKNNEDDVLSVFRENPEMILQTSHIATYRVNWASKDGNLKLLSKELDLDLGSFIFLDDSDLECALMESQCPEVLTVLVPHEQADILRTISDIWDFDPVVVTNEDGNRTQFYRQNSAREEVRGALPSLEEFISALNVNISFAPLSTADVERVSQLALRVTQFNLNGKRLTRNELLTLGNNGRCLTMRVSDRFGDYGLVGSIVFVATGETVRVRSLLLSCRALGRGVEAKLASYLIETARKAGANYLLFELRATARNLPIRNFLDGIGAVDHPEGAVVDLSRESSEAGAIREIRESV